MNTLIVLFCSKVINIVPLLSGVPVYIYPGGFNIHGGIYVNTFLGFLNSFLYSLFEF